MSIVRIEDASGWTLEDRSQDLRKRELRDAVGRSLGTIETMLVDTEAQRITSVLLPGGMEYPVRDLQIMENAVYYIPDVVPPAPPAAAPAPPPRPLAPERTAPPETRQRLAPIAARRPPPQAGPSREADPAIHAPAPPAAAPIRQDIPPPASPPVLPPPVEGGPGRASVPPPAPSSDPEPLQPVSPPAPPPGEPRRVL